MELKKTAITNTSPNHKGSLFYRIEALAAQSHQRDPFEIPSPSHNWNKKLMCRPFLMKSEKDSYSEIEENKEDIRIKTDKH